MKSKKGFTLIEVVVVIAVVAILAAILAPTVAKNINDSKKARALNECQVIAAAVVDLFKDTGYWPYSNLNGPSGRVDRVISDSNTNTVPTGAGPDAGSGAANWGNYGSWKSLGDYLFYNNPDDNTGGGGENEADQDYPTTGEFRWRGPYLDQEVNLDPWGRSYVISARYFPGGNYGGTVLHGAYILSAGPNSLWSTPYADAVGSTTDPSDKPQHDDIGFLMSTNF